VVSLGVGSALAVVGIVVAVAGVLVARRIAERSGAFRKAELGISLMGQSLVPKPEFRDLIFGYSAEDDDLVVCLLPFELTNKGELSAKNVSMRLVFPMTLLPPTDLEAYEVKGLYDKSEIKSKSFESQGRRFVDYSFPELPAGGGNAGVEQAIAITYGLGIPFAVDAVSKDGVPLRVEGRVEWTAPVLVRVWATDVLPLEASFTLKCYRARDRGELGEKVMGAATSAVRDKLSEIGAPNDFVSSVFAPGVAEPAILVMPKLNKIPKLRENMWVKGALYFEEPEESERWLLSPPRDVRAIAYRRK